MPKTLERETWEEAGLHLTELDALRPLGHLQIRRPVDEGYMVEKATLFQAVLPLRAQPANQDGEVAGFACLDADALRAELAAGPLHAGSRADPRPRAGDSTRSAERAATGRQASRSAITPATTTSVPTARSAPKPSFSHSAPSAAANSTEVSRSAATVATGACVIAHSAIA